MTKALRERYSDYEDYIQDFFKTMNIDPEAANAFVVPNQASHIRNYADYQKSVSENEDPYLTVVVNGPCSYLWCWLGTILPNFAANNGKNAYRDTISTLFGKKLNAKKCSGHIVKYVNTLGTDINITQSVEAFKRAMSYELDNFNSTTSSNWA